VGIAVELAEGSCFQIGMVDDVVRLDEVGFSKMLKELGDQNAAGELIDLFGIDRACINEDFTHCVFG